MENIKKLRDKYGKQLLNCSTALNEAGWSVDENTTLEDFISTFNRVRNDNPITATEEAFHLVSKIEGLQEAIDTIESDDEQITIIWSIDDVKEQATNDGVVITDTQAREVLKSLKSNHDANDGISWGTISAAIQNIIN